MLKLNNNIFTGASLFLLGLLALLHYAKYVNLSLEGITGIILVIYGIPSVYESLNQGKRNRLFFSSVLFFIGIIFIVKSTHELLDTRGLIFSSILFICGSSLFILFIENTKEKIFLYSAILLMLISYTSTTVFKSIGIIKIALKISNTIESFGPVVLLLLGLNLFLNRKR